MSRIPINLFYGELSKFKTTIVTDYATPLNLTEQKKAVSKISLDIFNCLLKEPFIVL